MSRRCLQIFSRSSKASSGTRVTIVNDYTWDAKHFIDLFKCVDNIVRVGEITCNVQLIVRAICVFQ